MEIISSKQQEEFKATTIVINILKLHKNPKVFIQGFVRSFETLITNVQALTCSFYLSYIIYISTPFKRYFLSKTPMYNCGVIGVES